MSLEVMVLISLFPFPHLKHLLQWSLCVLSTTRIYKAPTHLLWGEPYCLIISRARVVVEEVRKWRFGSILQSVCHHQKGENFML